MAPGCLPADCTARTSTVSRLGDARRRLGGEDGYWECDDEMKLRRLVLNRRALKARCGGRARSPSTWGGEMSSAARAPDWNLIKGGGARLRKKIVAQGSRREVIVADQTKCSPRLGTRHSVPAEVTALGWRPKPLHPEALGAKISLRCGYDGSVFRTDPGTWILDAGFGPIEDPAALAASLLARAAAAAVGPFRGLASNLIIGTCGGVKRRERSRP